MEYFLLNLDNCSIIFCISCARKNFIVWGVCSQIGLGGRSFSKAYRQYNTLHFTIRPLVAVTYSILNATGGKRTTQISSLKPKLEFYVKSINDILICQQKGMLIGLLKFVRRGVFIKENILEGLNQ